MAGDQYAVLLVDGGAIVGAWISFATGGDEARGLSLGRRYLSDITGLSLAEWAERDGILGGGAGLGPNADLAELGPTGLVAAFVEAVAAGDKTRAYGCLAPGTLLAAVTRGDYLDASALYQPGYGPANSVVEGLRSARLLSAKLLDPDQPGTEIPGPGNLSRVEVRAEVELEWVKAEPIPGLILHPYAKETGFRYFVLKKVPAGWRVELSRPFDLDVGHAPCDAVPACVGDFLGQHRLDTRGQAFSFDWIVPASWDVPLGGYLDGVYWGLANVCSKEVGLDLEPLKGRTVTVWVCPILPEPDFAGDISHAVLLTDGGSVVGAWLLCGTGAVGASVDRRRVEEIAGLGLEAWLEREGYFRDAGPNGDLADLGPVEVLEAYLAALSSGNAVRANACELPDWRLQCFTPQYIEGSCALYSPDAPPIDPIQGGRLISARLYDPGGPVATTVTDLTGRTSVMMEAELEVKWNEQAKEMFGFKEQCTRYVTARRTYLGWKIDGTGCTGP